jgi:hypothetical protein
MPSALAIALEHQAASDFVESYRLRKLTNKFKYSRSAASSLHQTVRLARGSRQWKVRDQT